MAEFTIRERIAAPPERVFGVVTDIPAAPEIIEGIEKVELLTDGPVGVGTRFRETRVMFGREAVEEMEVTEFAPPERYVLEAENHGTKYVAEHMFTPVEGGTEMSLRFVAKPQTTGAKLMGLLSFMFMGSAKKAMAADLADLKRVAESSEAGTST